MTTAWRYIVVQTLQRTLSSSLDCGRERYYGMQYMSHVQQIFMD